MSKLNSLLRRYADLFYENGNTYDDTIKRDMVDVEAAILAYDTPLTRAASEMLEVCKLSLDAVLEYCAKHGDYTLPNRLKDVIYKAKGE